MISNDIQELSNEKFRLRFVITGQSKGNRRPPEDKSWGKNILHTHSQYLTVYGTVLYYSFLCFNYNKIILLCFDVILRT